MNGIYGACAYIFISFFFVVVVVEFSYWNSSGTSVLNPMDMIIGFDTLRQNEKWNRFKWPDTQTLFHLSNERDTHQIDYGCVFFVAVRCGTIQFEYAISLISIHCHVHNSFRHLKWNLNTTRWYAIINVMTVIAWIRFLFFSISFFDFLIISQMLSVSCSETQLFSAQTSIFLLFFFLARTGNPYKTLDWRFSIKQKSLAHFDCFIVWAVLFRWWKIKMI